jgi:hypothetical protein
MITALEYQEKICCELSRARTLHFAHIELQHKTTEQEVEFLERERCKLHEAVDYFFQCLEQSEQPEKKERRRWWLDNKLDKIAVSGDL